MTMMSACVKCTELLYGTNGGFFMAQTIMTITLPQTGNNTSGILIYTMAGFPAELCS